MDSNNNNDFLNSKINESMVRTETQKKNTFNVEMDDWAKESFIVAA